jgi:TPR repeat protein
MCIKCNLEYHNQELEQQVCPLCRIPFPSIDTFEEKKAALQPVADDRGKAWAQFQLGDLLKGLDDAKSVEYFRMAAEQGHRGALHNLAYRYYTGANPAIPQSLEEAWRLFSLAAQKGNIDSQYNLGSFYINGMIRERNDVEAIRWFTLAAEQGHVQSQAMLASIFGNDPKGGLTQSYVRAKYWSGKAARQNDAPSQYNYAVFLLALANQFFEQESNVVGHSAIPKALFWLQKAKANGDKESDEQISWIDDAIKGKCSCCRKSQESMTTKLQRCSRCKSAYYCDRECLAKHWKMGHKADCNSIKHDQM